MSFYEYTIDLPGAVGPIQEEIPLIMPAQVRPYLVAMLLHHGCIRAGDLVAAISPRCNMDDLKVGAWDPLGQDYCDGTRLERLVDQAIADFEDRKLICYSEELGAWVLTMNDLRKVFSWVATLDAKFPAHLSRQIVDQQLHRTVNDENAKT